MCQSVYLYAHVCQVLYSPHNWSVINLWSWYGFVFAFCLRSYKMISMFHGAPVISLAFTHIDGSTYWPFSLLHESTLKERWTMKGKGLSLNTPVFDRPVCAQVWWYLWNVNYMWFGLNSTLDTAVAGDFVQPLQPLLNPTPPTLIIGSRKDEVCLG